MMQNLTQEDKLLIAKAEDTLRLSERRYEVKTLGFLNPHQRAVILENMLYTPDMKVIFDGGYEEAERTQMVCCPEFCEVDRDAYLTVLECTGRDIAALSHRDYLGSLMGLGIVREKIGDILVAEDKASIFVQPQIADYVIQNLTKIGRCGVHLKKTSAADAVLPLRPVREIEGTVSALRLDAVLSCAIGLARGKTADLIRSGQVSVNWKPQEEVSAVLKENDVISARGYGRMKLSRIGGLTRKGRYSITVCRYV